MSKVLKTKADKIPKGFKTPREWSKEEDMSLSHASRVLRELAGASPPLMERKDFKIEANGLLRRSAHYRKLD